MKALAIVSRGIEDVAQIEIEEIIGAKSEAKEGCVLFDAKDLKDICIFSYKTQSADRVMLLLAGSKFTSLKDIAGSMGNIKIPDWASVKSFALECERIGQHDFSSMDVQEELSRHMKKMYGMKMDFRNPEVMFFAYIVSDDFYLGIEFSGQELQKRKYKIYSQSNSLRGTIAYALVRLSGYKKGEVLLDPFTGDGLIAIEAALYASGLSPNYYNKGKFAFLQYNLFEDQDRFFKSLDKKKPLKGEIIGYDSMFKYVDYSRKNAKIAGVHDILTLSRVETGWLDVKFKGKSIDRIVTKLPSSIKESNSKLLNEFFYQAEFVLKDKGAVCLITHYPDAVKSASQARNFKLKNHREVWSGKQSLSVLMLHKG